LGRLTELDLGCNQIGDEGARALAGAVSLKSLLDLSLTYNPDLGPEGARALATAPFLQGLAALTLYETSIGNGGAIALAGSPLLAGLNNLSLPGGVKMAGAKALANAPSLANLTQLFVYAEGLPARARQVLRQRFGDVLFV
jgi:hypothetical protein